MRSTSLFLASLSLVMSVPASAETLSNDSVILMVRSGLSEDTVIAKINNSQGQYKTDVEDLISLKKLKIPDRIIEAMITSSHGAKPSSAVEYFPESGDPKLPHPSGVYLLTGHDQDVRMTFLNPAPVKTKRSGVFVSYALTGGIAPMSSNATLAGSHAKIQTGEGRPIFYFFFNDKTNQSQVWSGISINSPTDFALVRMDVKGDSRSKKIGKFNILSASYRIGDKERIAFTTSEIRPGVFEVIPVRNLAPGEYCFIYSPWGTTEEPTTGGAGGLNKVFDFSVVAANSL